MSSPPANGYDADLLNSVKVDKRAIQEGYSTDLLNDKPVRPSPAPTPPPQRVGTTDSLRSREPSVLEAQAPLKPRKAPFYRTKKGLIIIGAVLVAIIVAAVVGGVVGSRNSKGTLTPVQSDGGQDSGQSSTPGGQQGGEQASGNPLASAADALSGALSSTSQQTVTTASPTLPGQQPATPTTQGAPDPLVPQPGIDLPDLNSQAQALGVALD
ncbi:hypothetical protein BKA70DRAFT_1342276 [Coprinopsis sp. MPI-PUGE-AT-0042]|nr:hypothetical protein BKA70DRAFT_1342276 [Coprinopsis sp. MPI-PUGE-AT-0042]